MHFDALELIAACGHEDPVAVVQMQDGIGRDDGVCFLVLAVERCSDEHAQLEDARDSRLSMRTLAVRIVGIEHRADVADAACEQHDRDRR